MKQKKLLLLMFVGIHFLTLLYASRYDFVNLANINHGNSRYLARDANGTIFMSDGTDGLFAYAFDGTAFTLKSSVNGIGPVLGISLRSDGKIFLANDDKVRVYSYNGEAFSLESTLIYDLYYVLDVAFGADGTVYITDLSEGGISAYSYQNASFSFIDSIHHFPNGNARDIAVSSDETIFLANGTDGLRAYTFDGDTFTFKAHINESSGSINGMVGIAVGPDNTVFAIDTENLYAYNYNGSSFTKTAEWPATLAWGLTVGAEGTLFVSCKRNGLYAYRYKGNTFEMMARLYNDTLEDYVYANNTILTADSTVILANGTFGLSAYDYTGYELRHSEAPSAGSGSEGDPYQISTLANLYWMTEENSRWSSHYIQTADIDASETSSWFYGAGAFTIGEFSSPFTGTYNGQGYSIENLNINRPKTGSIGFFGKIQDAEIRNVKMTGASMTGASNVGILSGMIVSSNVSNCQCFGSVTGTDHIGALSGWSSSSNISGVYCSASATGNNYVGGLLGYADNHCTISDNYSRGTAISGGVTGGFIGSLSDPCSISNNYSTGLVTGNPLYLGGFIGNRNIEESTPSVITSNFWDVETAAWGSDGDNNYGAIGKTTVAMKTLSTFSDAGWDFTNIWGMDPEFNDGYPHLLWSYTPDVPLPITLTTFDAVFQNGAILLTWQTVSETENAAFRIYRDGEMIAELEGAGTISEPQSYKWTDQYVIPGQTYSYVLADLDLQGKETKHPGIKVEVKVEDLGLEYTIGNAYPNPFNPVTVVPLNLAKDAPVRALLYDVRGYVVKELMNGDLATGSYALKIDGTDLSTGIYILRVAVNDAILVQKIALMK
ncbi:MAG: T9SS type A sorting domain-containing protein [Candidatus Marinimicrobia bacterium]|nr:T9SS type A sorting domain-containing protein [Candidatus Neomarinimicrobiota bacterium]